MNKKIIFIPIISVGFLAVVSFGVVTIYNKMKSPAPPLQFEGDTAYQDVVYQMSLGPRIPDSAAHSQIIQWMQTTLSKEGWDVELQQAVSMGHDLENVIAKRGSGSPWIILGAHYDSRLWANQDSNPALRKSPVPGANDGASGVAVLMELGRTLPKSLKSQIWLVFFDAEDNGEIPGWDWLLGSEVFVSKLTAHPDEAVILDMIGDANLDIYKERNSNPDINNSIWSMADSLGYSTSFLDSYKYAMLDDHTPFLNAGIPVVDIIDFDYPYWHTSQDTADKVSANSLETVGNTMWHWLVAQNQ